MTMESLPSILFGVGEEDDMGDIEYLARIAAGELPNNGVLKEFIYNTTTTGTMATVPASKDWYLAGSRIQGDGVTNGNTKLEFPTATVIQEVSHGTVGIGVDEEGTVKGVKITAAATVTVTKAVTAATIVTIQVIEVDVGESPKMPT